MVDDFTLDTSASQRTSHASLLLLIYSIISTSTTLNFPGTSRPTFTTARQLATDTRNNDISLRRCVGDIISRKYTPDTIARDMPSSLSFDAF